MGLISIVTPVYRGHPEYLAATYDSLLSQRMPTGWEWEWLVQHDGPGSAPLPATADDDPRVQPDDGPRSGPGITRNLALSRARGKYVRNLDADDMLVGSTLAQSIDLLETRDDVGWTACSVLDLLEDGTLKKFDDPQTGLLPRNEVADFWMSHGRAPVHPTTITIRTELLLALGGWMGIPTSEDTGMLLAASTVTSGWFFGDTGLHYRLHAQQITRSAPHMQDAEARHALIKARVMALRQLCPMGAP